MTSANGNRQHRTSSAPSDSKRAARGKCKRQFITFIICVFLVGEIAGGLIVRGVQALGGNDAKEQPPYGTRDDKSVTENGELMLIQDAAGFTPLDCELSEELQEFTYYMCRAYYIDFDFTMSLMFSESSFNAAGFLKSTTKAQRLLWRTKWANMEPLCFGIKAYTKRPPREERQQRTIK